MNLQILKKVTPSMRGIDKYGSGAFGAPRGGTRTHKGIDPACDAGDLVLSVCAGEVTKIGFPYSQAETNSAWTTAQIIKHNKKKALRYVQITDKNGYDVRYFYIKPMVSKGDKIEAEDVIGEVVGVGRIYPRITEHVHFEVKKNGEVIDPNEYLTLN